MHDERGESLRRMLATTQVLQHLVSLFLLILFIVRQVPEGEDQPTTDVDLFISTERLKVVNSGTKVTCFVFFRQVVSTGSKAL